MTAEVFAEWLRRQDHTVIRTESSYWYDQGPNSYQAFPYHWLIQPSEDELARLMRNNRAISLRYSSPLHSPAGRMSYHIVQENAAYGFDSLSKWARKNVRRGLKSCSVEPVSLQRLAAEGWALQEDTLRRQNRTTSVDRQIWRDRCLAAEDLPGFEAWGALVSGELAASVITCQVDDCCCMLYQQCKRAFLTAHVNNALAFEVTRAALSREQIRSVFYCLHSLDAPSSMDEFKLRMGYVAQPVRQRVVFHPLLAPLVNRASHALLKRMASLMPSHQLLAKGEGMMRFYLEGKQPLEAQSVPAALQAASEPCHR